MPSDLLDERTSGWNEEALGRRIQFLSWVDYCRCAAAHKETPVMNKVLLPSAMNRHYRFYNADPQTRESSLS